MRRCNLYIAIFMCVILSIALVGCGGAKLYYYGDLEQQEPISEPDEPESGGESNPDDEEPTYTLSGTITRCMGFQSGVTLTLTGTGSGNISKALKDAEASTHTTTTDDNGEFSFAEVLAGTFTLTPTSTGYAFSPTSVEVTIGEVDAAANFIAVPTDYDAEVFITGLTSNVVGLAIDSGGNIFTAEFKFPFPNAGNRVRKYPPSGGDTPALELTSGGGENFNLPHYIAIGENDYLYVSDQFNSNIKVFNDAGVYDETWNGAGELHEIMGLAYASDGKFYLTSLNGIQRISGSGVVEETWASDAGGYLRGIGVDRNAEFLYVAALDENVVEKHTTDGEFVSSWGGDGPGQGEFQGADGVAVDYDGYVYVVDGGNSRVQKFDSNGNWLCNIGKGTDGGDVGQFSGPMGVTVDDMGSVYVSDTGNARVQKFTPQ